MNAALSASGCLWIPMLIDASSTFVPAYSDLYRLTQLARNPLLGLQCGSIDRFGMSGVFDFCTFTTLRQRLCVHDSMSMTTCATGRPRLYVRNCMSSTLRPLLCFHDSMSMTSTVRPRLYVHDCTSTTVRP